MMVMTTLDVFLRYVFNSPITGNYELQPLLLIGVVFLAAASIQAKRGHISLDLITSHLPKSPQSSIRLFSDLFFLFFAAVICWQFVLATQDCLDHRGLLLGPGQIPSLAALSNYYYRDFDPVITSD